MSFLYFCTSYFVIPCSSSNYTPSFLTITSKFKSSQVRYASSFPHLSVSLLYKLSYCIRHQCLHVIDRLIASLEALFISSPSPVAPSLSILGFQRYMELLWLHSCLLPSFSFGDNISIFRHM